MARENRNNKRNKIKLDTDYKKRVKKTIDDYKGELDKQGVPPSKRAFLENQIEFAENELKN